MDKGASLRDRATAAEPVVSALRDGIPSAWRFLKGYLVELWRVASPFLLCVMGGMFTAIGAQEDGAGRVVAFVLAGGVYVWALDFARLRAAAERDKDWGARTLAMLMDDHYTEITVTNKHTYYADAATRAAMAAQAIEAEGGDAKTGSVRKDESAVATPCAPGDPA